MVIFIEKITYLEVVIINIIEKLRVRIGKILDLNIFRNLSDVTFLKLKYFIRTSNFLNLKNPKRFNEKLQWLKLNSPDDLYKYIDKYEIRNHIKDTIGEKFLNDLLGVYESYDEINFEKLPNKFVIKATHLSGDVLIVKDKNSIDHTFVKKKLESWLKRNYYWEHRERAYGKIEPRIIIEKFLIDNISDYKFYCFNGDVKLVQVISDRESKKSINFYNLDWKKLNIKRVGVSNYKDFEMPQNFDEMVNISKKLSKIHKFVRVDLYNIEGEIIFGELTFFPTAGFSNFNNKKYDYLLGSWLNID